MDLASAAVAAAGHGHTLLDDQGAALAGQPGDPVARDHVRPGHLGQGGLDRWPKGRIHDEVLVEPAAAHAPGGLGDPAALLLGKTFLERRTAGGERLDRRPQRRSPRLRIRPAGLGGVGRPARRLPGLRRRLFRRRRGRALPARLGEGRLAIEALRLGRGRPLGLFGGSPRHVRQPPSGGVELRLPRRRRTPDGGQLLPLRLARRPDGGQLGERVGEVALRLGQCGLEVQVARRDRGRHRPSARGDLGLGRDALVLDSPPVPLDGLQLRAEPRVAELRLGQRRTGGVVGLPPFAFRGRPRAQLGRQRGRRRLGRLHLGHRAIGRRPGRRLPLGGRGHTPRDLVPAGMRREEHGRCQLVGRRLAARLLLRLGGEPARLRPQLGEDVLDPGEVRLRLLELVLRAPPSAFVAPDARDLLEQRPALLGPQGQRLVHHPLPDEQERVVGEMRGIEEIDEVAQPDPLLVQEVVVLARAVEAPAQLQDREVDRQEPVRVVDDERDIGHALGGAPVRPGPDDVLGLARPERAALLAEGPPKRVGEVALARPVRSDDRADATTELDVRALGERLEPLEAEGEEPWSGGSPLGRRAVAVGAHAPSASGRALVRSCSRASVAAAVSAVRRDGPSPTPSTLPSTTAWTRNVFS